MRYIVYNVDEQEKIAEFESMDMMVVFLKSLSEANIVRNFQIQCIQGNGEGLWFVALFYQDKIFQDFRTHMRGPSKILGI